MISTTKKIERLTEWAKSKRLKPAIGGSILMVPPSLKITKEMRSYARKNKLRILVVSSRPTLTLTAGYLK